MIAKERSFLIVSFTRNTQTQTCPKTEAYAKKKKKKTQLEPAQTHQTINELVAT